MSKDIQFFKKPVSKQEVLELINPQGGSLADGSIVQAQIIASGTGYASGKYSNVPFSNIGAGKGEAATADIVVGNNGIAKTKINNNGNGGAESRIYTNVDVISLTGSGTAAKADVEVAYFGAVKTVTIISPGTGGVDGFYPDVVAESNSAPPVGQGLVVNVTIAGGQLSILEIVQGGSGYLNPTSFVLKPEDVGGTGTINFTSNEMTEYAVKSITITEAGQNYSNNDSLSFTPASIGGVIGCEFNPTVIPAGTIYSVQLKNNGKNYNSGDSLTINNTQLGGTGSGFLFAILFTFNSPIISDIK
jgi:hypothetical protein